MQTKIDTMLAGRTFAVVGASTNPEKYGHIAYTTLKRFGKIVYPVNPRATEIDGDTCYADISSLPEKPDVVVSVVPSKLTEKLVEEIAKAGIRNLWIQLGAESAKAIADAEASGIACVHSGPCIMVCLTVANRRQS